MAKLIDDRTILLEVNLVPQTRDEVTARVAATLGFTLPNQKVENAVKNGLASLKKRGLVVSQRRRWLLAPLKGTAPVEVAPPPPVEVAPVEVAPPPPVVEAPVEVAPPPPPVAEEAFGLLTLTEDEVAQHEVYDLRCPDQLASLIAMQDCFGEGPVVGCEGCVLALQCRPAAEKRIAKERAAAKRAAARNKKKEEKRVALLAAIETDASAAGIDLSTVRLSGHREMEGELLTLAADVHCASSGVELKEGEQGVLIMGWGVVHPIILRAVEAGRFV